MTEKHTEAIEELPFLASFATLRELKHWPFILSWSLPRKIESLFIPGPAGRLEALLEEPEDAEPREAALVCHPHPQHGGTMHNKVVYRIARGLRSTGAVVLRFNYRGVNLSEGRYDEGEGELEDARAALSYLRARYPGLPFTVAGFPSDRGSRYVWAAGSPGR